ncbi:larval/pupal cuticle protein H1C-like [Teleopsis dalmanni]|uniref:larval/pupal cuticle protein H1C-like n=1 Tax=Teleopsis dalmanni TaxID=139649 RepID=UPI0018CE8B22|nr:larval/pupal cuticle protein H1C-like [Teleopsis dalmanni]
MAFKFILLCSLLAIANAGVLFTPNTYAATPVATENMNDAYAKANSHAVASTQENVVRSFEGTVSSYSKSVDTPYSSVRKQDTRISNNVYAPKTVAYEAAPTAAIYTHAAPVLAKTIAYAAPAVAKSVTYAAPAVQKTFTYAAPAPDVTKTVTYAAPAKTIAYVAPAVAKSVAYTAPAVSKSVTYAAPAVTKTYIAPAPTVYTHTAPAVSKPITYAAPAVEKTLAYVAPTVERTLSYAAPVVEKSLTYGSPAVEKTVSYTAADHNPATVYSHASPVVYHQSNPTLVSHVAPEVTKTVSYASPVATYNHGPAATTYAHNSPGVSAYGSSQTVHYSPAEMVSHMSFDGFGTHWDY